MNIQDVISFFQTHWLEILAIIGAIDVILGIVCKYTKTKIDDNIYTLLHNALAKIGKKP